MHRTIVEALERHARERPGEPAFIYLEDGEHEHTTLTFGAVRERALSIAHGLRASGVEPGERALLVFAPGLDFVTAFLGCLYAGVVAVPAYPPDPSRIERTLPRLMHIAKDCAPRVVLTTALLRDLGAGLADFAWLAVDELPTATAALAPPSPDALAFLQYTSGSTAAPKGVMITHANLAANSQIIHDFRPLGAGRSLTWLPLYHDMGLIDGVLQPLWAGARSYVMPPSAFLQRPARWLEAITRYQITKSGGPNFAYALCVRKVSDKEHAALDLSSWRFAYSGAEPVRWQTVEQFTHRFGSRGFRADALTPVYGLAEATLAVSGARAGAPPRVLHVDRDELERTGLVRAGDTALVSCGPPAIDVRVVDPAAGRALGEDTIGELWLRGASVASGYFRSPAATEAAFGVELDGARYYRTGDIGFLHEGELFVTGRLKDLLIVRGRNVVPSDVEITVEAAHKAVRTGCSVAFSVDAMGSEAIAVACEIEPSLGFDTDDIITQVREAVAAQHEVALGAVILLPPRTLPKTSSGKVRRQATKAAFFSGALEPLATFRVPALQPQWRAPPQAWVCEPPGPIDVERLERATQAALERWPRLREEHYGDGTSAGAAFQRVRADGDFDAAVREAAWSETTHEPALRVRVVEGDERQAIVVALPHDALSREGVEWIFAALADRVSEPPQTPTVEAPRRGEPIALPYEPTPMAQDVLGVARFTLPNVPREIDFAGWLEHITGAREGTNVAVIEQRTFGEGGRLFVPMTPARSPYELAFFYSVQAGRLRGELVYKAALFPAATMQQWAESLAAWLTDRTLVAGRTRTALWASGTRVDDDEPPLVLDRFRRIGAPFKCAEDYLSRAEIDAKANGVAQVLIARGLTKGQVVLLRCDPGFSLFTALLGAWKAGGAAMLVHHEFPKAYLERLVQPAFTLTNADLAEAPALPAFTSRAKADDVAFVQHTAYEGRDPHPIRVTHRALARQAATLLELMRAGDGDVFIVRAPPWSQYAFLETAAALLTDRPVYLTAPPEHVCQSALGWRLYMNEVTALVADPTFLRVFMNGMLDQGARFGHFRRFIVRSEPPPAHQLQRLRERAPQATLIGLYSLAELSGPTLRATSPDLRRYEALPYVTARVLGKDGALVPPGVFGELCVGGPTLARDIPETKLTRDPFTHEPLVRTGDRARWLSDGTLEIGARDDTLIKMWDFRITLSEMARVLREYPGASDAHVERFVNHQGVVQLAAFVVSATPDDNDLGLRAHITQHLPYYVHPETFQFVSEIPRRADGTLDRDRLPPPWGRIRGPRRELPATPTERALAAIWSEVLGVAEIGRDQSFFDLGGDSFLGLQMMSAAQAKGLEVTPRIFAVHHTIRTISLSIEYAR